MKQETVAQRLARLECMFQNAPPLTNKLDTSKAGFVVDKQGPDSQFGLCTTSKSSITSTSRQGLRDGFEEHQSPHCTASAAVLKPHQLRVKEDAVHAHLDQNEETLVPQQATLSQDASFSLPQGALLNLTPVLGAEVSDTLHPTDYPSSNDSVPSPTFEKDLIGSLRKSDAQEESSVHSAEMVRHNTFRFWHGAAANG